MKIVRKELFRRTDNLFYTKTCDKCGCTFEFALYECQKVIQGIRDSVVGIIYCPKCGRKIVIRKEDTRVVL